MSANKDQDLSWAIKNGDMSCVKAFVENEKLDVNKEMQGRNSLHYAADYGHTDIIEYLLSKGANINACDKYGMTPLLSAIYEGHTECVDLLLKRGADKTGKSPDGVSYIDCAEKDEIKALLK